MNKLTPIQELDVLVYNLLTDNGKENLGGGVFIFDPQLKAENIVRQLYAKRALAENYYR